MNIRKENEIKRMKAEIEASMPKKKKNRARSSSSDSLGNSRNAAPLRGAFDSIELEPRSITGNNVGLEELKSSQPNNTLRNGGSIAGSRAGSKTSSRASRSSRGSQQRNKMNSNASGFGKMKGKRTTINTRSDRDKSISSDKNTEQKISSRDSKKSARSKKISKNSIENSEQGRPPIENDASFKINELQEEEDLNDVQTDKVRSSSNDTIETPLDKDTNKESRGRVPKKSMKNKNSSNKKSSPKRQKETKKIKIKNQKTSQKSNTSENEHSEDVEELVDRPQKLSKRAPKSRAISTSSAFEAIKKGRGKF
jgi:hypothetical protein